MMIHSGEKPHKCDLCDKSFRRSDALQCHQKTHKKEIGKRQVAEVKVDATAIVPTYPLNEMTYTDSVVQYNDNQKHMQLQDHHDQSQLINEVGESGMANIESITVLRPHQIDLGEQSFNTFSYNFIL